MGVGLLALPLQKTSHASGGSVSKGTVVSGFGTLRHQRANRDSRGGDGFGSVVGAKPMFTPAPCHKCPLVGVVPVF